MANLGALDSSVFMAVDIGSEVAGFCVGVGREHWASGQVNVPEQVDLGGRDSYSVWSRVEGLGAWVMQQGRQYNPDFLILEMPMGDNGNRHTDRVLGSALGVCILAAYEIGAIRVLCTPQEVKATGYHKKAQRDASLLVGVHPDEMTPDRADAIGLWQAGWLKVRNVVIGCGIEDFVAIDVLQGNTYVARFSGLVLKMEVGP